MNNLLYFIICIFTAIVLAYFVSGSGGFFILFLLAIALIISLVTVIGTRSQIALSLSLSSKVVNKGEDFSARLDITKKHALQPTSFIEVTLAVTPNVASKDNVLTYKMICSGLHGDSIDIPLNAVLCGGGEISVEKVVVSDYLGLLNLKMKRLPPKCKVNILPRIPDTGSQTEVLRSVSERISFDDSDEESDETSSTLTGVPGYEHREYVPGDPLKRVNWKLSSKKDQFMVRLDEKVTSSSQVFRLDLPKAEVPDFVSYRMMDIIIEGSLAMLGMLVKSGYESEYNYFIDGQWEMAEISDEGTLVLLQERLAGITPYPKENREPDHNINEKGKAMLCFTSCTAEMSSELAELSDSFEGTLVVVKESGISALRSDMWSVNREFEFSKLT